MCFILLLTVSRLWRDVGAAAERPCSREYCGVEAIPVWTLQTDLERRVFHTGNGASKPGPLNLNSNFLPEESYEISPSASDHSIDGCCIDIYCPESGACYSGVSQCADHSATGGPRCDHLCIGHVHWRICALVDQELAQRRIEEIERVFVDPGESSSAPARGVVPWTGCVANPRRDLCFSHLSPRLHEMLHPAGVFPDQVSIMLCQIPGDLFEHDTLAATAAQSRI